LSYIAVEDVATERGGHIGKNSNIQKTSVKGTFMYRKIPCMVAVQARSGKVCSLISLISKRKLYVLCILKNGT